MLYASLLVVYAPKGVDNIWIYNLFYLITIISISYYFYKILKTSFKRNIVAILLVLNIIIFLIYDVLSGKFFKEYNEYVFAVCFISIVVYAFLFYDHLLRNVTETNILYSFEFWLVSGYLFYFLGSFILILFYKAATIPERGKIWALQNEILFLSSIIILIGTIRIRVKK